jgi:UDP-2,3-diacylglucosamine pyrophosphatase LpxH
VKTAVAFIADFETAIARDTKSCGVDGVICGHIHAAADRELNGVRYLNCGDWVESCTAVIERDDGRMELVQWRVAPDVTTPSEDTAPALWPK